MSLKNFATVVAMTIATGYVINNVLPANARSIFK